MEKEDNVKNLVPQDIQEMIGKKPLCMIKMELHQCILDTNELGLMFAMLLGYSKLEQVSYDKLNYMRIVVRKFCKHLRKEYSDFFGDKKEEGEEVYPKKKLSEITREFLRTLCAGIRKHKNETAIFWRDWKVEHGLVTRDAYGKGHPNTWVDIRLYNDMWEAFDRLKSVLESLVNYFEAVEKYNEDYTDKSIILHIQQMDRERISYTLHRAEMELSLLKWDEPLEEKRKEEDK